MNRKVQFFIIYCMVAGSLLASKDRSLTLPESIVAGGLGGFVEVTVSGQPLTYWMNQKIKNKPFVLKHSYQGFAAHAGGVMPITATYKAVQAQGSQFLKARQDEPLTQGQNVGVSCTAGLSAALFDTPSNAVQIFLQKEENKGKSTMQACKELRFAGLGRGYGANAILKEGPFAVGLQVLVPIMNTKMQKYVENKTSAQALGAAAAGVMTAVVTQPGAVVRNTMQADYTRATYTSTVQTVQKICKEQGPQALLKGVSQRGARIAIAMPLFTFYNEAAEKFIKE
jgi:Mitochondrial carrier protein